MYAHVMYLCFSSCHSLSHVSPPPLIVLIAESFPSNYFGNLGLWPGVLIYVASFVFADYTSVLWLCENLAPFLLFILLSLLSDFRRPEETRI